MLPGSIKATSMCHGCNSIRSASAMDSSAFFDAEYGPTNGRAGARPAIELMNTIRPPAVRIAGRKACVTASWPVTFTSS